MKMKINYLFDVDIDEINPSMVHVMKMCQAFAQNGCDITLYCTGSNGAGVEDAFRRYAIHTPFRVVTVPPNPFLVRHGHRLASWDTSHKRSRLEMDGGVLYARSTMSVFLLRSRAPFVFESHMEPDRLNRQIERIFLKHPNCKGLVVISRALKERYLEIFPFLTEDKITVLHDAADTVELQKIPTASLRGETRGKNIGYVGSLFPGKCMETLLPLAKRCPEHRFHVVGGTPYWVDHWKAEAEKLGISNIEFYGFVDNSRLGEYYKAFDMCVLPFSRNIYIGKSKRVDIGKWTSPLKLFEAMAYGKPMVVSRLATIEEVMSDAQDCIMAQPDDIDDWVEKVQMLCADANLRERIAVSARQKLEREYTWTERAKRAAAIFQE